MKYKKLVLLLSLIIMGFIYFIYPHLERRTREGFKNQIIRFHIRANSDRKEDQELKLKIRDEILKEMVGKFENTKSLEESREIIKNNLGEMKAIAEKVMKREGWNYPVEISLKQESFPTRKYGNLVLPSDDYEALLITLGEGKGENWWCVMFPPLCFVDITHSVAYNLEKELGVVLSEDEEPTLKLKWKIVELVKKLQK